MGKKRKSIATSLDEVDRTMYASFCSAANSLSQLYTQSMNHQKLSFQAGERQSLVRFPRYLFDLRNTSLLFVYMCFLWGCSSLWKSCFFNPSSLCLFAVL
ncbi:hypothetical protein OIU77_019811 [Salix suchowensis]|uniref:Uncharacterized protein n=1 Tax=Salix suchowensis TaxID=1278906 RepID=A0ABQ9CJJ4_9ROSI|nr:hypothetical protein OIU77_019811 [Salix suchowensis]